MSATPHKTPHKTPVSQLSLGLERPERVPRQPVRATPHAAEAPAAPADSADSTLSASRTVPAATAFEEAGCAIGRDYARHGLMPPPDHLHAGHPVREGWEAARRRLARPGQRLQPATRHVQLWLDLRLTAWLRGRPFDTLQVTPRWLARIDVTRCPVTREVLTHGHGAPTDAVVVALRPEEGFVAGNLVVLSRRVASVLACAKDSAARAGLDERAAQRVRSLQGLATALPHARACAEPLALVPPVRVHVRNPAHALQALVGTLFRGGGYARRMSELGTLVPGGPARRAYALFMSALLARRLDAPSAVAPQQVREVLEDAWLHPSVQQRWQAFVGLLSAAQCERVVHRALGRGVACGQARWVEPRAGSQA